MTELKNCPFCGSDLLSAEFYGRERWSVVCATCNSEGPYETTEQAAIEAWNARPSPWISVADDQPEQNPIVPELGYIVLCADPSSLCNDARRVMIFDHIYFDTIVDYKITHWQPITPPQETGEE